MQGEDTRLPGLPRYVRINTLKLGAKAADRALLESGYRRAADAADAGKRSYHCDEDVPDLLVFKPKGKSDISRLPLVATGEVVVQQKASCFPALALAPPPGAVVIDGCAAPGNKTSHLAMLMENRGRVLAFDMNERRCALLRERMALKGASIVSARHASFLSAAPADPEYAGVTHVLLDPSCSSSGMSLDPITEPAALAELASNQRALLLHAMAFPGVTAIVYSTCSVNEAENEMVVAAVLQAQADAPPERRFRLVPALPAWHRRGHRCAAISGAARREEVAACCVRTLYPDDGTIGFFVARFEREAAAPPPPSDALLHKLKKLGRERAKRGRRARGAAAAPPEPGAGGEAEATAAAQPAPRPVPDWRRERDERKKRQRGTKA